MRLAEMPKVETVIVPTYDFWGGVGEPTICVVAPAVLNAHLRRDRQAGAQPAAEEREAGLIRRLSMIPKRVQRFSEKIMSITKVCGRSEVIILGAAVSFGRPNQTRRHARAYPRQP